MAAIDFHDQRHERSSRFRGADIVQAIVPDIAIVSPAGGEPTSDLTILAHDKREFRDDWLMTGDGLERQPSWFGAAGGDEPGDLFPLGLGNLGVVGKCPAIAIEHAVHAAAPGPVARPLGRA